MSANIVNQFIVFNEGPLIGKSLHSLWLRERLSDEKNLDKNNFQRLYEPSLLDENISIKNFTLNANILKIIFSDGEIGYFLIDNSSLPFGKKRSPGGVGASLITSLIFFELHILQFL